MKISTRFEIIYQNWPQVKEAPKPFTRVQNVRHMSMHTFGVVFWNLQKSRLSEPFTNPSWPDYWWVWKYIESSSKSIQGRGVNPHLQKTEENVNKLHFPWNFDACAIKSTIWRMCESSNTLQGKFWEVIKCMRQTAQQFPKFLDSTPPQWYNKSATDWEFSIDIFIDYSFKIEEVLRK